MFRSATFKLTLWYLAIVMAISLMFSAVLYQVTTNELERGFHRESQRIFRQYPIIPQGDPGFGPGQEITSSSHRILLQLISLNVIVLVGAGYASYWLARRTLQPIEEAHEQQKRFTADVSHELRTPLTALKMESEVALMNTAAKPAELRGTIQSNLEEVEKLENLINSLLRLTRLEADELQQTFKPVQTSAIVAAAVEQLKKAATARDVTITTDLKKAKILGDNDSLTQLLVILLDNAIKYSNGGTHVQVTSRVEESQIVLQVIDHGMGIEPAALEHIFDRFYRADSSRNKTETSGFGLGLSIAKMIADMHRGVITVSSLQGQGTTVTVSFPAITKS